MIAEELKWLKAFQQFQQICQFMEDAQRDGWRVDQIERGLVEGLFEQGRLFLQEHVESFGDGNQGESLVCEDVTLVLMDGLRDKRYLSVFGEVPYSRCVYAQGTNQKIEYAPVDALLGMPAGDNSYVLEDWQQRLCVKDPFGQATEDLKTILGTGVSVRTAEAMNRNMSVFAEQFFQSQDAPPPDEEGELLVVTADGKGVPMRRTLEERLAQEHQEFAAQNEPAASPPTENNTAENTGPESFPRLAEETSATDGDAEPSGLTRRQRQKRLDALQKKASAKQKSQRGEKKTRKQMAYVGAVYSIDPFERCRDEVLDEVSRRQRNQSRPHPQHKRVWAEMTRLEEGERLEGRSLLFAHLAIEVHERDPQRRQTLICLMDGEHALWDEQDSWLPRAVQILDIFHALERLWTVANIFHKKGSRQAEEYVEHHLGMLLEGKVDYVVRNLRKELKAREPGGGKRRLAAKKRKKVESALTYYRNNRQRMRYDEYLSRGYPIGSGVAEGACRHLVKDRLELTGMRWEHVGAQAMIYLRALFLNGSWREFIDYRVEQEQATLYGAATCYPLLLSDRQAA